jgi:hypothetical protein
MGISRAREVNFTTGLPLLQEKKFNRAQTHRWHSGKYSYRSAFLYMNKFVKYVKNIQYIIAVSKSNGYNDFE